VRIELLLKKIEFRFQFLFLEQLLPSFGSDPDPGHFDAKAKSQARKYGRHRIAKEVIAAKTRSIQFGNRTMGQKSRYIISGNNT